MNSNGAGPCDQLFRFELSVSGKMELGYYMMHGPSMHILSTLKSKYDVVYTSKNYFSETVLLVLTA